MNNQIFEAQLRDKRRQTWSGLADAAKNDSLPAEDICLRWSQCADELLTEAFQHCFNNSPSVALFCLGKLGSKELNLSSDVDLLLIAAEDHDVNLSALRQFQKVLSERTSAGFVFRVDFDLRPGGKMGPLFPTVEQFKDYYGNYGETWERLAFVRLRFICGAENIKNEIQNFAQKFSFRRHLDFTLLEDLKNLRSKIQGHYWSRSQNQVIDLKLGIGGIRDIELFTHALQVIHGGKDPSLQIRSTTEALQDLGQKGLLPVAEAQFLRSHYWNLRRLENYVQALHDEQTHLLKTQENHPAFVREALKTLTHEMSQCDLIVKGLLGDAPKEISLDQEIKSIGLPESDLQELWQEILGQEVLSRHKGRDEASRKAFLAVFLDSLKNQNGDIRRGLLILKDFIHGTRAKASFFSMLLREKELLSELTWLFGHSPYLSRILCNRPELLDSFVYRAQDKLSEDLGTLLEDLAEKKLLSEVINGSQFLKDRDLSELLKNLSSTADSIAETLLNTLKKDFPSKIEIVALGKWGGHELGFRSDLDFIFVVPDEPEENDFKIAKRFITRLTESHRGGNIYSIDMRLRPSGKAGPLVITEKELEDYLQNSASAWERQAYLKARVLGSDRRLQKVFIERGLSKADLEELEDIRKKLLQTSENVNLKYAEGGLVDIELATQSAVLLQKTLPPLTDTQCFMKSLDPRFHSLQRIYGRLRQTEQMLQLVASDSSIELQRNHESFQALALVLQTTPEKLWSEVSELLEASIAILKELDPRRRPH